MAFVKAKNLKQMTRTMGQENAVEHITEAVNEGELKPSDFSIRDLAEGLVENGREWVASMDPRQDVMESGSSVDSTAFLNITKVLLEAEVLEGYNSPAFTFSQRMRVMPTRFSGERIPGVGKIGDKSESIQEGMPYPSVGFGEDYIDAPATDKRGLIVPVTKEAIFFDRTGLVLERARGVGEALGLKKEKNCVDVVVGATDNYVWQGTAYNTYQSSTPWVNLLAGAAYALSDWSDVDTAEQLLMNMTDPNTGEPIAIMVEDLFSGPAKKQTINRIVNATETRQTTNTNEVSLLAGSPYSNLNGFVSQYVRSRLIADGVSSTNADQTWFLGNVNKAFAYHENWPITVSQAPQNSEAEFKQDIVAQFKASERGVAAVRDPRYMVRVNGHA